MALPPKDLQLPESLYDTGDLREYGRGLQNALNPYLKSVQGALNGTLSLQNLNAEIKVVECTVPTPNWTSLAPLYTTGVSTYATGLEARYLVNPGGRVIVEGTLTVPSTNPYTCFTMPTAALPDRGFEGVLSAGSGNAATFSLGFSGSGQFTKITASTFISFSFSYQALTSPDVQVLPFAGSGWPLSIQSKVTGTPVTLIPLSAQDLNGNAATSLSLGSIHWILGPRNTIQINRIDGLVPGHSYKIGFLIFGA